MEVQITKIGTIDRGIDGGDEYVLLNRLDDDLTPEQAVEYLLPPVYRNCMRPGGYFCNMVTAVQAAYRTNEVICTICHRYDN